MLCRTMSTSHHYYSNKIQLTLNTLVKRMRYFREHRFERIDRIVEVSCLV